MILILRNNAVSVIVALMLILLLTLENNSLTNICQYFESIKVEKNYIKSGGMLIRTDKQFRHLIQEEIVSAVYEKLEKCGIWIPYYEVEKYYCTKKNKYLKRYENAKISAID